MITIVAVIFTPIVIAYQGWTYHIFRRRLGGEPAGTPLETPISKPSGSPAG